MNYLLNKNEIIVTDDEAKIEGKSLLWMRKLMKARAYFRIRSNDTQEPNLEVQTNVSTM